MVQVTRSLRHYLGAPLDLFHTLILDDIDCELYSHARGLPHLTAFYSSTFGLLQ